MMKQIATLLLVVITLTTAWQGPEINDHQNLASEVSIIEDNTAFRDSNPRIFHTPLERAQLNVTIVYSVGSRSSGDKLIANLTRSDAFPKPKNVLWMLKYPEEDVPGKNITYAEAVVTQSSPMGYMILVSGGPGESHIAVLLGAVKTSYFNVEAKVYGN